MSKLSRDYMKDTIMVKNKDNSQPDDIEEKIDAILIIFFVSISLIVSGIMMGLWFCLSISIGFLSGCSIYIFSANSKTKARFSQQLLLFAKSLFFGVLFSIVIYILPQILLHV